MAQRKTASKGQKSKRGYQEAERPPIEKWEANLTIEGVFVARREAQFGYLYTFRTAEGTRIFGGKTILDSKMDTVPEGSQVKILCLGKVSQESGREAWDYKVLYMPPAEADDDIPF